MATYLPPAAAICPAQATGPTRAAVLGASVSTWPLAKVYQAATSTSVSTKFSRSRTRSSALTPAMRIRYARRCRQGQSRPWGGSSATCSNMPSRSSRGTLTTISARLSTFLTRPVPYRPSKWHRHISTIKRGSSACKASLAEMRRQRVLVKKASRCFKTVDRCVFLFDFDTFGSAVWLLLDLLFWIRFTNFTILSYRIYEVLSIR
ncbi:hypothetical protein LY78DRAFT_23041 [Colletotrichum sublineola]|nr:hypothetical protein LY78DRAFT_23041 [Colletotrichum sublineola]